MADEKKYDAFEVESYMEDFLKEKYPYLDLEPSENYGLIVVGLDGLYTQREIGLIEKNLTKEYMDWVGKEKQPEFSIENYSSYKSNYDDVPGFSFDEEDEILTGDYLEMIPEIPEETVEPKPFKEKQKPKKRKRSVQIMTRLTPEEAELFKNRVEKSGQKQADFIRAAILTGHIKELPKADDEQLIQLNDSLLSIKADLGKIGGLLKSIIKPQAENELISERDWYEIKKIIKVLQKEQKHIEKEVNKLWQ